MGRKDPTGGTWWTIAPAISGPTFAHPPAGLDDRPARRPLSTSRRRSSNSSSSYASKEREIQKKKNRDLNSNLISNYCRLSSDAESQ